MSFPEEYDLFGDQLGERCYIDTLDDVSYHPESSQESEYVSWGLQPLSPTADEMCELEAAAQRVKQYSPDLRLSPGQTSHTVLPTTTVVSAFFPPPANEEIVRQKGKLTITRSVDEYLRGIRLMVESVRYLVLFLPREYALQVRPFIKAKNIVVYEHYPTVWKIPNMRGRHDEFYTRQLSLASPGGTRKGPYGHPHAWAAWNAKAYLVLEAIFLNPFKTSHFAWLDVRTPLAAETYSELFSNPNTWPSPAAVKALYDAGAHPDRAVVTALDRALRPVETPYWPCHSLTGEPVNAALEDIWSLNANIMIGSKFAMARLSRAQLLFMERDMARGVFIGREEYQLSYLHFEFKPIISVLEVFRRRPFADKLMRAEWFAYYQLAKDEDPVWTGMVLEEAQDNNNNDNDDDREQQLEGMALD